MQVNNNVNFNQKSTPAFGWINYGAAKDALRNRLSLSELKEFTKIVKANEGYKNAELILFGEKGNKIWGRIVNSSSALSGNARDIRDYQPWIFESPMHFIKRLVPKMQKRDNEVKELIAKQNFDF